MRVSVILQMPNCKFRYSANKKCKRVASPEIKFCEVHDPASILLYFHKEVPKLSLEFILGSANPLNESEAKYYRDSVASVPKEEAEHYIKLGIAVKTDEARLNEYDIELGEKLKAIDFFLPLREAIRNHQVWQFQEMATTRKGRNRIRGLIKDERFSEKEKRFLKDILKRARGASY